VQSISSLLSFKSLDRSVHSIFIRGGREHFQKSSPVPTQFFNNVQSQIQEYINSGGTTSVPVGCRCKSKGDPKAPETELTGSETPEERSCLDRRAWGRDPLIQGNARKKGEGDPSKISILSICK